MWDMMGDLSSKTTYIWVCLKIIYYPIFRHTLMERQMVLFFEVASKRVCRFPFWTKSRVIA